jgi:hypothetical protein
MLLSEICGLVSEGRPLWREDGSTIYSVITQWSESLKTRNHTLLSHLRLPQSGGPDSRIYIPQEQGYPVIPPGTGFSLRRLLRLATCVYLRSCYIAVAAASFVISWSLSSSDHLCHSMESVSLLILYMQCFPVHNWVTDEDKGYFLTLFISNQNYSDSIS